MSRGRFTKKQLKDIRRRLVERYSECDAHVRSDVRTIMEQGVSMTPCGSHDIEDPGTELTATIATRRRADCQLLADAIHRVDNGTYGTCVDCGDDIADRRLTHAPEVATCIGCQEERETTGIEDLDPFTELKGFLQARATT